jgi:hypothetical protein
VPAEGIHLTALREATSAPRLAAHVRRRLVRGDDAARFGAILPDLPYFDRYAGEVLRYVTGRPARPSRWGAVIHNDGGAVALLGALLALARRERDETLAAIALGLASHCAIDRALHPLINALARRHRGGPTHDAAHREVEKFQSICFHEEYIGRDTMGTPDISGLLAIHLMGRLDERTAARLREAWRTALGPLEARELAGFLRGYRIHAWLLGTPAGRRVAPPAAKDAARPRYLHGAWGTFGGALEGAVTHSLRVLEAAADVVDASDADAASAFAALAAVLPTGTIDPQGEELDLDRPFAPVLLSASGAVR